MKLVLDTLNKLGSQANSKTAVLHALLATKDRHSVLGTYSFDKNGDTTLKAYGLYKVKAGNEEQSITTVAGQKATAKFGGGGGAVPVPVPLPAPPTPATSTPATPQPTPPTDQGVRTLRDQDRSREPKRLSQ